MFSISCSCTVCKDAAHVHHTGYILLLIPLLCEVCIRDSQSKPILKLAVTLREPLLWLSTNKQGHKPTRDMCPMLTGYEKARCIAAVILNVQTPKLLPVARLVCVCLCVFE